MSLPKFISLLSKEALFLSRSDLLGDPYEGTIPVLNSKNIQTQFCDPSRPDLIVKVRKMFRLFTYISCWHMNDVDSEAMWRLYCPQNDGIALQTSYDLLSSSIPNKDIYIGRIKYIDYRTESITLANALNVFMHKRIAFKHENEVRIVKWLTNEIQSVENDFNELRCSEENPKGIYLSFDIAKTIQSIHVNPHAPEWYIEVVKSVMDKFEVKLPLHWSHIAEMPNF